MLFSNDKSFLKIILFHFILSILFISLSIKISFSHFLISRLASDNQIPLLAQVIIQYHELFILVSITSFILSLNFM